MSLSSQQNAVARIQKEIANLRERIAKETKAEGKAASDVADAQQAVSRTKNPSMLRTKQSQVNRLLNSLAGIQKNKASLEKTLGQKLTELARAEERLRTGIETSNRRNRSEADRERRTQSLFANQERAKQLDHQRALTREYEEQTEILKRLEKNKEAKAWRMGTLFVMLFFMISSVVYVFATSINNSWIFLLSFLVIPTLLLILIASTLRTIGDLSEKGFLEIIGLALKFQLKGIPLAGKFVTDTPKVSTDIEDGLLESSSQSEFSKDESSSP